MIPIQNISDVVLEDDVIKAIKDQRFHIYAITTIQEGLEVLTGRPYDTIQEKVKEKLKKFNSVQK